MWQFLVRLSVIRCIWISHTFQPLSTPSCRTVLHKPALAALAAWEPLLDRGTAWPQYPSIQLKSLQRSSAQVSQQSKFCFLKVHLNEIRQIWQISYTEKSVPPSPLPPIFIIRTNSLPYTSFPGTFQKNSPSGFSELSPDCLGNLTSQRPSCGK